jgi:ADP-ribosylation factor GTPase-activating protein 2/3
LLFNQNEKKYKTKAAQEYKRHLSKLQNDERGSAAAINDAIIQEEADKGIATKWESSSGLDDMMLSLSGKEREPTSTPPMRTVEPVNSALSFPDDETVELPAPPANVAETKAAVPTSTPAVAIGTLSVSSIGATVDNKDDFGDFDNMPTRVTKAPVFGKKSAAPKKATATRLLSSSAADDRFESFESVEKRATKAVQEAEDHKIATQLQTQENSSGAESGVSRLGSIYKELEAANNSRSTPYQASTSSSIYGSSKAPESSTSSYGASSTSAAFNVATSSESYAARNKYSSNKGISSDQFFGRDEEDMEQMKNRLNKLSTANAIGSDMLSNDDAANDWQSSDHRGGRDGSGGGGYSNGHGGYKGSSGSGSTVHSSIDQLKDTVSNFIGDIQSRLA